MISRTVNWISVKLLQCSYRISRNTDCDINLAIWWSCRGRQTNLTFILATSMGFPPYSNEICQFLNWQISFQSHQHHFLSKSSNIMFAYISAYIYHILFKAAICWNHVFHQKFSKMVCRIMSLPLSIIHIRIFKSKNLSNND